MKTAFITGNSSGLGRGLSQQLLSEGYKVFGCSRRGCDLQGNLEDIQCDLTDHEAIPLALSTLLHEVEQLDLVVLNAGMLGRIKPMSEHRLDELQHIMNVNVWSNKSVLDWLLGSGIRIDQIILMSSGAAVLGNNGWGGYSLSKATLNMLARLYAHEFANTHLSAIAPGLIDTDMMDYLCFAADSERFPALKRLREARNSDVLLSPLQAAQRILSVLDDLRQYPSGDFVDIRRIVAPEEYAALIQSQLGRPD